VKKQTRKGVPDLNESGNPCDLPPRGRKKGRKDSKEGGRGGRAEIRREKKMRGTVETLLSSLTGTAGRQ